MGAFVRFKKLWYVSGGQDRARLLQHVNTVFSSKNKKNVLFLPRKATKCRATAT